MADYVPLTQQEIIRRMRLPEDDPNYVNDPNRALLAPAMIYGGAFMPELGGVARAGQAAKSAIGEIPSYLSSAREALMRSLGYQTPTMRQAAARLVEPGAAEAALPSALTTGQMAGRTALAGTPLIAATAMSPSVSQDIPANYVADSGAAPAPLSAGAGRGFLNERPGERYAAMVGAGRGNSVEGPGDRAAYAQQQAVNAAKQRMAAAQATGERAGLPPARPADADGGLFSKIFSGKDYQSNNQLVSTPMGGAPVNWGNSDSAADFFRADKALSQMKAQQAADAMSGATTERRGGSVTGKGQGQSEKMPDPVHKALEIIHHLLMRH